MSRPIIDNHQFWALRQNGGGDRRRTVQFSQLGKLRDLDLDLRSGRGHTGVHIWSRYAGLPLSFLSWAYVLQGVYFWAYRYARGVDFRRFRTPSLPIFGVKLGPTLYFEIIRSYMNGRFSVMPGKDITIENLATIKPSRLQANCFKHRLIFKEFLCCLSSLI